jgi:hypothetical protein
LAKKLSVFVWRPVEVKEAPVSTPERWLAEKVP